jgi:hypothetical protein
MPAEIVAGLSRQLIPDPAAFLSIEIALTGLGEEFRFEVSELDDSKIKAGLVILRARFTSATTMIVRIFGESEPDGFQTNSLSIGFETSEKTAESDFTVSTLKAALSLAKEIHLRMPGSSLDLKFRLNEPLRRISETLKLRQTMYRLMVIQSATGKKVKVPSFISGEDLETINVVYHAIVERSFGWQFEGVLTVFYEARNELACELEKYPDFSYPMDLNHSFLGVEVSLGEGTFTIIDKRIEDSEHVNAELRTDDGHPVEVRVRSHIGFAHYGFPNAPHLPPNPWNDQLQTLIGLEGNLDAALLEGYHALAAASLAGLSEDEKKQITGRSTIGAAFLVEEVNTENV